MSGGNSQRNICQEITENKHRKMLVDYMSMVHITVDYMKETMLCVIDLLGEATKGSGRIYSICLIQTERNAHHSNETHRHLSASA